MNRMAFNTPSTDLQPALPALLALAVFVSFFLCLGDVPLFDLDEGAFTEATREMLQRRDFISTWLNGAPRFDKPVLIYWLQAGAVTLFGQSEWAFRLPSALCAAAWVWVIFLFVRRERGAAARDAKARRRRRRGGRQRRVR